MCVLGNEARMVASLKYAFVAQQVEQRTENPRSIGSIPIEGTITYGSVVYRKVHWPVTPESGVQLPVEPPIYSSISQ